MLHRRVETMLQKRKQRHCWSGVAENAPPKKLVHLWQVSVHQPFFLFAYFSLLFFCFDVVDDSELGSSSSSAPKKKQRNDDEPPGSPSSANLRKKTKRWRRAREARHHLLHLRKKKAKKWRRAKEAHCHLLHLKKCRRCRWVGRRSTRCHLLGFCDPIDCITTSPGFLWSCWNLRDCITT